MTEMQFSFNESGPRLYLCSTPIGNLQDVSLRLLDTLRTVDVVAAEDTRQTRKLLTYFDIHPAQLVSYHAHNRRTREPDMLRWWGEGKSVALVTDAGTPGISDPGDDAAALALAHAVPVIPIPGPSAVLAALVASGLPSLPFTFVGFLPRDNQACAGALQDLAAVPGSIVFYESPHRLSRTLQRLAQHWPNRSAALAKELTKRHEGFARDTLTGLADYARSADLRGEYVIVVGPAEPDEVSAAAQGRVLESEAIFAAAVAAVRTAMAGGQSHREAVKQTATQTGVKRADLYRETLRVED